MSFLKIVVTVPIQLSVVFAKCSLINLSQQSQLFSLVRDGCVDNALLVLQTNHNIMKLLSIYLYLFVQLTECIREQQSGVNSVIESADKNV